MTPLLHDFRYLFLTDSTCLSTLAAISQEILPGTLI
jgi:hypothetical protein